MPQPQHGCMEMQQRTYNLGLSGASSKSQLIALDVFAARRGRRERGVSFDGDPIVIESSSNKKCIVITHNGLMHRRPPTGTAQ